jgi:hypothetical protein
MCYNVACKRYEEALMSEHWRPEAQYDPEPERPTSASWPKKTLAGLSVAALATSSFFLGSRLIGDTERQRPDPAAESPEDAPGIGNEPAEYEPGPLRRPDYFLAGVDLPETGGFVILPDGTKGATAEAILASIYKNKELAYRHQDPLYLIHTYHDYSRIEELAQSIRYPKPPDGNYLSVWFRVLEEERPRADSWYMRVEVAFDYSPTMDDYHEAGTRDIVLVRRSGYLPSLDPNIVGTPYKGWVISRDSLVFNTDE